MRATVAPISITWKNLGNGGFASFRGRSWTLSSLLFRGFCLRGQ
jgi:hypothetical protein